MGELLQRPQLWNAIDAQQYDARLEISDFVGVYEVELRVKDGGARKAQGAGFRIRDQN